MEYQYPCSQHWTTEEIIAVIDFFQAVEKAYEKGIARDEFMSQYRRFKKIVPGKAEEKKVAKEFEELSGYSAYLVFQKAQQAEDNKMIFMKSQSSL
ncbi:UPF0223 family protein [Siminovitchia sp. 179-K 8D1 HS]|uniref:UPF0223 family protein n=1 Tax=Siminovitchia sp. 179-K 8D1 HS TaxID=3142385 RepID=UPI00399FD7FC